MPSTGRPWRARPLITAAKPRSRSHARSDTVARVPGSTTRSASASSAGAVANLTSTPGSAASASRSVKLLIRGSRTTLTRKTSLPNEPSAAIPVPRAQSRPSQSLPPGQDAVALTAGESGQHPQSRREQARVTAELVDHETRDQRLIEGIQEGDRPVERRENAASVNVPDDDDRQVGRPGQPHVGDVGVAQVDLGRAARALADDHVELGAQLGQAVEGDTE